MPLIDLGGTPAWEDCAQLGRTLGFDDLNRLELDCYEAALGARNGAPPEGCAFRCRDHAHDFGIYRTLALETDDRLTLEAHRYVEAVGKGLDRWLDAGFRAPVEYVGGAAVRVRSLGVVVLGALQVTCPGPDRFFPLRDFAALHANLAEAFPRLAARFRQQMSGAAA